MSDLATVEFLMTFTSTSVLETTPTFAVVDPRDSFVSTETENVSERGHVFVQLETGNCVAYVLMPFCLSTKFNESAGDECRDAV